MWKWSSWWWLLPLTATALPSYVVQRRAVAHGTILETKKVASLKDCSTLCTKTPSCSGFNFIIDAVRDAHCLLVSFDLSKPSDRPEGESTKKLLADAVLYSGKRLDLLTNSTCAGGGRSFTFERWPHRTLKQNSSILEESKGTTLESCLSRCQARDKCLSAIFHHPDLCLLSAISPNTVYNTRSHFDFTDEADLYENNCRGNDISRFDGQCTWMRVKSAGLPDQWDSKEWAADADDCERLCGTRDRETDPCRSYTFDSKTGTCYLSQVSARLSGRSPLEHHDSRYAHGDLDDCIDFSLHCQENGLELRGTSIRQFSGFVRTKEGKQLICNKVVQSDYDYAVKMGFEECGFRKTELPYPQYRGVVHVKEGSTQLITIRDKVLQVECRLHDQMPMTEQTIAVAMTVEEGNRTDKILSNKVLMVPTRSPPLPRFSLTVLDEKGAPADLVRFGESGWVRISLNQREVASSFSVSKLEARDTKNNIRMVLLDDEGCVTNRSIVMRISRPNPAEFKALINYEFFDQGAEVVFYAYAEPCSGNCDPKCNEEIFEERGHTLSSSPVSIRTRRSITAMQIELSQDLYPLHGSKVILLGSAASRPFQEMKGGEVEQAEVEQISWTDSLVRCVFHDSTCFFSFALASIQFSLIVMCLLVTYCYFRQYRRYRAINPPPLSPAPIEETKY